MTEQRYTKYTIPTGMRVTYRISGSMINLTFRGSHSLRRKRIPYEHSSAAVDQVIALLYRSNYTPIAMSDDGFDGKQEKHIIVKELNYKPIVRG